MATAGVGLFLGGKESLQLLLELLSCTTHSSHFQHIHFDELGAVQPITAEKLCLSSMCLRSLCDSRRCLPWFSKKATSSLCFLASASRLSASRFSIASHFSFHSATCTQEGKASALMHAAHSQPCLLAGNFCTCRMWPDFVTVWQHRQLCIKPTVLVPY